MAALTSRERALRALNHEPTDRVAIDLGGIGPSAIHLNAHEGLVRHLGLEALDGDRERQDPHATRGMARLAEPVLAALGVDFRGAGLLQPDSGAAHWLDVNQYIDEWGVRWTRGAGNAPMAAAGPFEHDVPTSAELEQHRWPVPDDPGRVRGLRGQFEAMAATLDAGLVLQLPYGVLREHQRLRGFANAMMDLLLEPALTEALLHRALDISAGAATAALAEVGDLVDVVCFQEDLGTQDRPYMAPDMYRRLLKPFHRRLVEAIRSSTSARILLHSDGAVYDLIGDFIDIGIDALNPIQVSAVGMGDTKKLKQEFGRHLVFWGAIDTQHVLPFGSPADVAAEVKRRVRDLGPGGGYVLASVHTINAEVPGENVAAMLTAARECRFDGADD